MTPTTQAATTIIQHYTPFSYFFEVGVGIALGIVVVILPSVYVYARFLKGRV